MAVTFQANHINLTARYTTLAGGDTRTPNVLDWCISGDYIYYIVNAQYTVFISTAIRYLSRVRLDGSGVEDLYVAPYNSPWERPVRVAASGGSVYCYMETTTTGGGTVNTVGRWIGQYNGSGFDLIAGSKTSNLALPGGSNTYQQWNALTNLVAGGSSLYVLYNDVYGSAAIGNRVAVLSGGTFHDVHTMSGTHSRQDVNGSSDGNIYVLRSRTDENTSSDSDDSYNITRVSPTGGTNMFSANPLVAGGGYSIYKVPGGNDFILRAAEKPPGYTYGGLYKIEAVGAYVGSDLTYTPVSTLLTGAAVPGTPPSDGSPSTGRYGYSGYGSGKGIGDSAGNLYAFTGAVTWARWTNSFVPPVEVTPLARMSTLTDGFGSISTAKWDQTGPASIVSGAVQLGDNASGGFLKSDNYYDFDIAQVQIVSAGSGGVPVRVEGIQGTYAQIQLIPGSPMKIQAQWNLGTFGAPAAITYSSTNHKFARITRLQDSMTFALSKDGNAWTTLGSTTIPQHSYLREAKAILNGNETVLDNFNIGVNPDDWGPEPGDGGGDGGDGTGTGEGPPGIEDTTTPAANKTSSMSDTFNASSIDSSKWTTIGPVREEDGLAILGATATPGTLRTVGVYNLDFAIMTIKQPGYGCSLWVASDLTDDYLRISVIPGDIWTVGFDWKIGLNSGSDDNLGFFTIEKYKHFRILRRNNSQFVFSASQHGWDWETMATVSGNKTRFENVRVLMEGSYESWVDAYNIVITEPEVTPPKKPKPPKLPENTECATALDTVREYSAWLGKAVRIETSKSISIVDDNEALPAGWSQSTAEKYYTSASQEIFAGQKTLALSTGPAERTGAADLEKNDVGLMGSTWRIPGPLPCPYFGAGKVKKFSRTVGPNGYTSQVEFYWNPKTLPIQRDD